MKKLIEKIKGAKTMIVIAAVGALGLAGIAATSIGVNPSNPLTSVSSSFSTAVGVTNTTSLATNGYYTAAIGAAGASFAATETNLVPLNVGLDGDTAVLTFQAQAMAALNATNVQYVVTSLPKGLVPNITNNPSGWASATQPRSIFGTFTLTLNGTTPVLTNIVLSPSSSPPFNKNLALFLETITVGVSNNFVTNHQVSFRQQ